MTLRAWCTQAAFMELMRRLASFTRSKRHWLTFKARPRWPRLQHAIDLVERGVPIVGDLFDLVWKSNDRNFTLLKRHRADRRAAGSPGYWLSVCGLVLLGLVCIAAPLALLVWLLATYA